MAEVEQQQSATATATPPAETIEHALRAAVDELAPDTLYAADALRAFLLRRCPDAEHDVSLLLIGLEEEIPQALLGLRAIDTLDLLAQILQQRLSNRRSLNRYASAWIVKVWSDALRLSRMEDAPVAIPAAATSAATIGAPPAPSVTDRQTSTIPSSTSIRGPGYAGAASPTRWVQIGVAITAMIVISFAILFESRSMRSAPAPSDEAGRTTEAIESPGRARAAVASVPRASADRVEIVDVGSDEALVGDGKQRPLFAALRAPRDDVARVESRFVDGDGALRSGPIVVNASTNAGPEARVPAGAIGIRTTRPTKATFEYVVVTNDGTRSAPFTKQFAIAPMAATPPTIAEVSVPAPVVSGKPFDVTIAIRDDDRQLASIERTVVGDDGSAKAKVVPVSTLKRTGNAVTLPINATWSGPSATIELTLLAADGAHGETKRVVFDVLQPVPSSNATALPPPTMACTRTTCGSVVSVHEMAGLNAGDASRHANAARPNYEIIVRTDDRAIHTFRQPTMLRAGARARVVDGKLLVMNTVATTRPAPREGKLMPESEPLFSP